MAERVRESRSRTRKFPSTAATMPSQNLIHASMLIEARHLSQAVELAKGCPILEASGSVEVRLILKLTM